MCVCLKSLSECYSLLICLIEKDGGAGKGGTDQRGSGRATRFVLIVVVVDELMMMMMDDRDCMILMIVLTTDFIDRGRRRRRITI